MTDDNPSIVSHVSIGTNDFDRALAFYEHEFYEAALAAGAQDSGAPGPRPQYGEPYYGCFVRDPDGHKIEAAFWDRTAA